MGETQMSEILRGVSAKGVKRDFIPLIIKFD